MLVYLAPVALALFVLVALIRLRASGDGRGADEGPAWGDGGGSVPTPPRGPIDPDDSAAWWPEFERQFAEWVERTHRAEAGVGTRSSG